MQTPEKQSIDYLFETSWEISNKVGGIHTVVATKSILLKNELKDHLIMIGPELGAHSDKEFIEDPELFSEWRKHLHKQNLKVRIGRWKVKSNPVTFLVDSSNSMRIKNQIFGQMYEDFQVDSLSGAWDYVEPAMFGHEVGVVIKSFVQFYNIENQNIIAQFHEWMTVSGALFLKNHLPAVSTVFTTHATVLGRCLGTNSETFYTDLKHVNAEHEARKYNVYAKHSLERAGAQYADCCTTVSAVTAFECEKVLGKKPELTPNGFEPDFVPEIDKLKLLREQSKSKLIEVFEATTGNKVSKEPFIMISSGRYEYKNKGFDVLVDVLNDLRQHKLDRTIITFITVPAGHNGPNADVLQRLENSELKKEGSKVLTHYLNDEHSDPIIQNLNNKGFKNDSSSEIHVIFVPSYLNGDDGVFNVPYYELLAGADLSIFPSYYEPWGYTPLESLAFAVPTVTTSLSGFGQWLRANNELKTISGAFVVERNDDNYDSVVKHISMYICELLALPEELNEKVRENAIKLSELAVWKNQINYYRSVYQLALEKAQLRKNGNRLDIYRSSHSPLNIPSSNQPEWKRVFIENKIPDVLQPMLTIAQNVWWSWNREFLSLLNEADEELWKHTQNPVAFVRLIRQKSLNELKENKTFISKLNSVYSSFEAYVSAPKKDTPNIAYFSMEYGLDASIHLYSGGLGILAGDYLKQASDQNLNLTGIGLLYQYGYFKQMLTLDGVQICADDENKFTHLPLLPVWNSDDTWMKIEIPLCGRNLQAKIWELKVGRISLYLMDTNIPENIDEDKYITDRLYGGDREHRLKQEIVLGIGGIKLLKALNLEPDVYHLNEGHAAFANLERVLALTTEEDLTYFEAKELVRNTSVFTTHTPVPAGHDSFSEDLIRLYIGYYSKSLNLQWDDFMALGRVSKQNQGDSFSMSYLAIKLSSIVNGVSKIHGNVSRAMFQEYWSGFDTEEVPIESITNGVHLSTWATDDFKNLFKKHLGEEFEETQDLEETWNKVDDIPNEEFRSLRLTHKRRLIQHLIEYLNQEIEEHPHGAQNYTDIIPTLSENMLIIGFARRFAPYKRALLLFQDLDRLQKIIERSERPILFLFSGKAHPADGEGQRLIKRINEISLMPAFQGKVLFIENYNMHLAQKLVSGVDVWLNTPARPLEASGTSGMKAVMNGVLNFSVLDGWWAEAFRQDCGWGIAEKATFSNDFQQNQLDALIIYSTLENKIIPEYFENNQIISDSWIQKIKNTYKFIVPHFTMQRMLNEYISLYNLSFEKRAQLTGHNFEKLKDLCAWQRILFSEWTNIELIEKHCNDFENNSLIAGENVSFKLVLALKGLTEKDILPEIVFNKKDVTGKVIKAFTKPLEFESKENGRYSFKAEFSLEMSGVFRFAFRITPKHSFYQNPSSLRLVKWF